MLFTLYVWDAPQVVKCIVSMFADDTKLYTVLTDRNSNLKLNNDLASMQTWSSRMQMTFNIEKCKVLHLGSNNRNHQYTMPMSGEEVHTLEVTIDEKDSGVTIDNQLNFSMHVQTQVAKANRILGCLRHTFKYLRSTIFLQLYKAMIRPHLEYASCIWFPKLKRDSDAIERIQRWATKLVHELRTLTYTLRFRQLKLPTLVYRRRRADMLQTYKFMHIFNQLDQDVHCPLCPQKECSNSFKPSTLGATIWSYILRKPKGSVRTFLQPESSVTGTTWQTTLYMQGPSTFSKSRLTYTFSYWSPQQPWNLAYIAHTWKLNF